MMLVRGLCDVWLALEWPGAASVCGIVLAGRLPLGFAFGGHKGLFQVLLSSSRWGHCYWDSFCQVSAGSQFQVGAFEWLLCETVLLRQGPCTIKLAALKQ